MGADGYYSWEETTTTVPICTLCGWRGDPVSGAHDSRAVRAAFYAHFHASCIINAAAGRYDDWDEDGPRSAAALKVLEALCHPCDSGPVSKPCGARNGWCEHRQPGRGPRVMYHETAWSMPVPDWARI